MIKIIRGKIKVTVFIQNIMKIALHIIIIVAITVILTSSIIFNTVYI
jgi:hypothetical protein